MKPDSELKTDVSAELAWDPAVDATAIDVAVNEGRVTVSGHVAMLSETQAVERAVRRVYGVRAIELRLDVKLAPWQQRTDQEIALAVDAVLAWVSGVPTQDIRATVKRGYIHLSGEVDWDYQRKAVQAQLRPLVGVLGIRNGITLKHRLTPADLVSRIEGALERQARRAARHIEVSVDTGTVTLRGLAQSWQERDAIVGAAWAAPGVCCVVDEVQVGSQPAP
ncbi:MAG: BON domain-containing protein [Burkholderiales bacterium]|jgi:osmotically-inducible protein OsmY|nr:BON domain-containing protein [Burkholderiales bacterium]